MSRPTFVLDSIRNGFPCGSAGKESAWNAGDLGSIPGLGRSPGEGKGYPLQYSDLENPMGSMGSQRVRHDWATFTFIISLFYQEPVPTGQCLILIGWCYDVPTVKYFDHNVGRTLSWPTWAMREPCESCSLPLGIFKMPGYIPFLM